MAVVVVVMVVVVVLVVVVAVVVIVMVVVVEVRGKRAQPLSRAPPTSTCNSHPNPQVPNSTTPSPYQHAPYRLNTPPTDSTRPLPTQPAPYRLNPPPTDSTCTLPANQKKLEDKRRIGI